MLRKPRTFIHIFLSINIDEASEPGTVLDAAEATMDQNDKGRVGRHSWCFCGTERRPEAGAE